MGNYKLTLFLSFFPLFLAAQTQFEVEGFISSKTNDQAIKNAEICLLPFEKIWTSDDEGHFTAELPAMGKYTLKCCHLGFITFEKEIEIKKAGTFRFDFQMSKQIQNLAEVTIKAKAFSSQTYQTEQISQKEIRELAAHDIGDIIRKEPNLSGVRKGAIGIDPVLRGFKNKQLTVITDGATKIEGGCPNRMDPSVSHIEIDDIAEIEILKGPYALRFGPSFGGVIHLKTIQPKPQSSFSTNITAIQGFESNWNGRRQHLAIDGGNDKIYFNVSGNNNEFDNYKAGNGEEIQSAFSKYNYRINLGISPVKGQQLVFGYDRSYGRNVGFPALPMDERSDDTRLLSFDYSFSDISKTFEQLNFNLYHSEVHHIMDNKDRPFSDTVVAISDITALNYGGRLESFIKLNKAKMLVGIDLEKIHKNGQRTKNIMLQPNLPVKIEDLWKHAEIQNIGIYGNIDKKINQIKIVFAARLDLNSANSDPLLLKNMMGKTMYENQNTKSDFTNFSISSGLLWEMNKSWAMGFTLGRGVRSPDMTERYIILLPTGYDRYDYLGNPDLKPEANHETDFKIKFEQEQKGIVEFNTFFSYVTDFITGRLLPESQIMPQTADVLGVKEFYNADHVYLYGFEFSYFSPQWGKFAMNATAAITQGINPDATKYIVENGNVTGETKIKNDPLPEIPPFESTLDFVYQIKEDKLKTKLAIRMVAAQDKISHAFYEDKTPGFVLADFGIDYVYNQNFSVSGGVNNIFDKTYYEHLNRRVIGSKSPLYEPGRIFYINLILKLQGK
jgi:iron complex outermembrane recepter protein